VGNLRKFDEVTGHDSQKTRKLMGTASVLRVSEMDGAKVGAMGKGSEPDAPRQESMPKQTTCTATCKMEVASMMMLKEGFHKYQRYRDGIKRSWEWGTR